MWFQNRRAKWRKQARLQILQDAWRMRCLGLTNSSVVMPNDRQRLSPRSDVSSPPSQMPTATSLPAPHNQSHQSPHSLPMSKTDEAKMGKSTTNDDAQNQQVSNDANNSEFTLMHPAFQNSQSKRKYCSSFGNDKVMFDKKYRDEQSCFLANTMPSMGEFNGKGDHLNPNLYPANGKMYTKNSIGNRESGDSSDESSDSEEIDLTSNGCIDFSNNNNNNNDINKIAQKS